MPYSIDEIALYNRKVYGEATIEPIKGRCSKCSRCCLITSQVLEGLLLALILFCIICIIVSDPYPQDAILAFFLAIPHTTFYVYTIWALCKRTFGHFIVEIIALIYCIAFVVLSLFGLLASLYMFYQLCLHIEGPFDDIACVVLSVIPMIVCIITLFHTLSFLWVSYEVHQEVRKKLIQAKGP